MNTIKYIGIVIIVITSSFVYAQNVETDKVFNLNFEKERATNKLYLSIKHYHYDDDFSVSRECEKSHLASNDNHYHGTFEDGNWCSESHVGDEPIHYHDSFLKYWCSESHLREINDSEVVIFDNKFVRFSDVSRANSSSSSEAGNGGNGGLQDRFQNINSNRSPASNPGGNVHTESVWIEGPGTGEKGNRPTEHFYQDKDGKVVTERYYPDGRVERNGVTIHEGNPGGAKGSSNSGNGGNGGNNGNGGNGGNNGNGGNGGNGGRDAVESSGSYKR